MTLGVNWRPTQTSIISSLIAAAHFDSWQFFRLTLYQLVPASSKLSFQDQGFGPQEHANYEKDAMPSSSIDEAMIRAVGAILVAAGLLLGTASLGAHHGNAPFDMTHSVKMQGTVTDFQWINPHALIHADLKGENGKVANWRLELGSLGMLKRFGWTPATVKPGDRVTVEGFRAKDGSPYMCTVSIDLPNGQSMRGSP